MSISASSQITLSDLTDGYSVSLTSYSYVFTGGTSAVSGTQTTKTQVYAFCGAEQVNCTVGDITTPTGLTVSSDGSSSAPTLTITATTALTSGGVLTIPVTINGEITIEKQFSYAIAFKGGNGAQGVGVSKTLTQYYLSTSSTSQAGGSWSEEMPEWQEGYYLWQREVTVLNNAQQQRIFGTPILAKGLNSANESASSAQTTANTANATAEAASTTATEAKTTAETAKAATDELNTLIRETDEGVEVAKIDSEGGYVGMRTEQTSDAYLIKDADGNTLASYGANAVELGKGNTEASITMCDGTTQISTHQETEGGITYTYGNVDFPNGYGYVGAANGETVGRLETQISGSSYAQAELHAKTTSGNKEARITATSLQAASAIDLSADYVTVPTITDITDTKQAVNLEYLEWKLIGSATGTTSISFDMSKYKELFYVIYPYDSATSRQPYAWSKHVLTKFFEVETNQMRFDFIRSEASTRAWGWISKALGTARMGGVLYNGNDVTSYSKLYLYGR